MRTRVGAGHGRELRRLARVREHEQLVEPGFFLEELILEALLLAFELELLFAGLFLFFIIAPVSYGAAHHTLDVELGSGGA